MVKQSLCVTGIAILTALTPLAAVLVAVPAPAGAEPDRYIPDLSSGYCPGGRGGRYHSPTGLGYCDGIRFPDGSYWHSVQPNETGRPITRCVVNPNGDAWPKPAPPGGCGGAVQ